MGVEESKRALDVGGFTLEWGGERRREQNQQGEANTASRAKCPLPRWIPLVQN